MARFGPSTGVEKLTAELQKRSRQLDNLENSLLTTSSELKKLKENHAETLKEAALTSLQTQHEALSRAARQRGLALDMLSSQRGGVVASGPSLPRLTPQGPLSRSVSSEASDGESPRAGDELEGMRAALAAASRDREARELAAANAAAAQERLAAEVAERSAALRDLRAELERQAAEVAEARAEGRRAADGQRAAEALIGGLRERVEAAGRELEASQAEARAVTGRLGLDAAHKRLRFLEDELEEACSAQVIETGAQEEVVELRAELAQERTAHSQTKAQLAEGAAATAAAVADAAAQLERLNLENAELQKRLAPPAVEYKALPATADERVAEEAANDAVIGTGHEQVADADWAVIEEADVGEDAVEAGAEDAEADEPATEKNEEDAEAAAKQGDGCAADLGTAGRVEEEAKVTKQGA
ncbi:hypothetical protein F751_6880 [Auxenochlorella protothecoides]|uniref:Uncharacterized protein n=1 Tax=Auxenochlorella protothecoides TaxID=3075 RepID=A0A087SDV8_AUXPR|nr:hypothetical protein F751_6880 [Auxenochlorella protothecoides]KFM23912.1 hypothetical protein F751_6880 [Auxenochlorella protothecoides]